MKGGCKDIDGRRHVLIPVHTPNHWWLFNLNTAINVMTVFDSCLKDDDTFYDSYLTWFEKFPGVTDVSYLNQPTWVIPKDQH